MVSEDTPGYGQSGQQPPGGGVQAGAVPAVPALDGVQHSGAVGGGPGQGADLVLSRSGGSTAAAHPASRDKHAGAARVHPRQGASGGEPALHPHEVHELVHPHGRDAGGGVRVREEPHLRQRQEDPVRHHRGLPGRHGQALRGPGTPPHEDVLRVHQQVPGQGQQTVRGGGGESVRVPPG